MYELNSQVLKQQCSKISINTQNSQGNISHLANIKLVTDGYDISVVSKWASLSFPLVNGISITGMKQEKRCMTKAFFCFNC